MAKSYIVAGQVAPGAATDAQLYQVPANKAFIASTLVVANRSSTDSASVRVAIVPTGETLSNKHYVEYDRLVAERENHRMTWGMALPAGTQVIVRSSTANTSYSLFGVHIDA